MLDDKFEKIENEIEMLKKRHKNVYLPTREEIWAFGIWLNFLLCLLFWL